MRLMHLSWRDPFMCLHIISHSPKNLVLCFLICTSTRKVDSEGYISMCCFEVSHYKTLYCLHVLVLGGHVDEDVI